MKTDPIFKNYLEPIIEQKANQDFYKVNNDDKHNPPLSECVKFLMNFLSGKMRQLPFKKVSILCNTKQSCDKFISRYKEDISVIRIKDGL